MIIKYIRGVLNPCPWVRYTVWNVRISHLCGTLQQNEKSVSWRYLVSRQPTRMRILISKWLVDGVSGEKKKTDVSRPVLPSFVDTIRKRDASVYQSGVTDRRDRTASRKKGSEKDEVATRRRRKHVRRKRRRATNW